MMKFILLVEGLSYMYRKPDGRIIHFQNNAPREVEDSIADELLRSSNFMEIPYSDFNSLEGVPVSVKFTGTIGDAVVTANCMAAKATAPMKIVGMVMSGYRPLVQKICPNCEFRDWRTQGRGNRHIDLGIAARTGGEGFAWEKGIAYALGFSQYPSPPEEISFSIHENYKCRQAVEKRSRGKVAVLHLWSAHSRSKSYDPIRAAYLIRGMQDMGYDCILVGGRQEPRYAADFIDMRGECTLVESAAILAYADVVISVDSWVWHMSKLLRKPQVVLFGSLRCEGSPRPWERVRALRGELCAGKDCNIYSCSKSQCIDSIEVETILESVLDVVEESQVKREVNCKVGVA